MVIINTEMFVWWGAPTTGRGEWIYISKESGAPSLMVVLMQSTRLLFADNLAMTYDVSKMSYNKSSCS